MNYKLLKKGNRGSCPESSSGWQFRREVGENWEEKKS